MCLSLQHCLKSYLSTQSLEVTHTSSPVPRRVSAVQTAILNPECRWLVPGVIDPSADDRWAPSLAADASKWQAFSIDKHSLGGKVDLVDCRQRLRLSGNGTVILPPADKNRLPPSTAIFCYYKRVINSEGRWHHYWNNSLFLCCCGKTFLKLRL